MRRRWRNYSALLAVVGALALVTAGSAFADGTLAWNGINGATACATGTTGTMLWIFNPHSTLVVPGDLTVDGVVYPASGWAQSGSGQNWHYTVPITSSTGFPPTSASLDYSGALGDNPVLTISGCNEGGTTPPAAEPSITKDAAQTNDFEYTWTIDKAVDRTSADAAPGATATFNYTVTLTHDGGAVTNVSDVTGNIVVSNNNVGTVTLDTVTDELSDGTVCSVDTSSGLTIPGKGFSTFPYTCGLTDFPTDYPATTNTATMTWSHQILTGPLDLAAGTLFYTTPVVFTQTTTDDCATVSDTYAGGPSGEHCVGGTGDVAGTFTFNYSRTITAGTLGTCADYGNTASFADNSTPQNTGESSQSVRVCSFRAPLTIGYWGNHLANSARTGSYTDPTCSNRTLPNGTSCSSNGPWTKQYLPKTLGNYTVDTILKAAQVFAANNCSNATKSDSNAAACLAAQLLAAKLNVANGSNTCINATIASADAFLIAVGYNGPGSAVTFNATHTRAGAIALKTALDTYNNGGGCPV
jgi:hypothetical protein